MSSSSSFSSYIQKNQSAQQCDNAIESQFPPRSAGHLASPRGEMEKTKNSIRGLVGMFRFVLYRPNNDVIDGWIDGNDLIDGLMDGCTKCADGWKNLMVHDDVMMMWGDGWKI